MTIVSGEVVLFHGDGRRQVLHRFDASMDEVGVVRTGRHVAAVGTRRWSNLRPEKDRPLDLLVFDQTGRLLWRHQRRLAGSIAIHRVSVAANDAIAVGAVGMPSLVRMPTGEEFELPDLLALGEPDTGGWVPVSVADQIGRYGFVHAPTRTLRPLSLPVAGRFRTAPAEPLLFGGRMVYLGVESGRIVLVDEGVQEIQIQTYPLDQPDDGRNALMTANGRAIAVRDERPTALWRPRSGVIEFHHPEDTAAKSNTTRTTIASDVALVVRDGRPLELVDLESGEVRPVQSDAVPSMPATDTITTVAPGGRYFLGTDRIWPLWRVDTSTATAVAIDLKSLAPLWPFESARYCAHRPAILDDGRLVVALRDRSIGGIFVGDTTDNVWLRVGRPVSQVMNVEHYLIGSTWVIRGQTLQNTYCPYPGNEALRAAWDQPEELTRALVGESLQVIPPNGIPIDVPPETWLQNFHDSGLCALDQYGDVHDFAAGTTRPLGASWQAIWLDAD